MIHDSHKIIVILGPTASGKTEWGIKIAKKFNGEVICADSRTVYKYFDIGTAKPKGEKCVFYSSRESRRIGTNREVKKIHSSRLASLARTIKNLGCLEVEGVRHYLLDFIDPKKVYTAAQFQADALKAIEKIIKKKKLPIIVGGSALYIYALTRGYQFQGKGDKRLRRKLESRSLPELQAMVKKSKKISLNSSDFQNKRRLIRAIEVLRISNFEFRISNSSPLPYQFLKIGITRPRKGVYQRIDQRTERWLKQGLIDEVKQLLAKKIPKDRIIEFGLGYREVIKYLAGEIKTQQELIDRINFSQHAFVRRQITWFKKDKEIKWCKNISQAEKSIKIFSSS